MKRTEVGLLRRSGRLFFRTACAGMLAGAMIAMSALPAMADPAVIPGGVIEDTYEYKINLTYNGAENYPDTIPLQIFKVAEVVKVADATDVYEYKYVGTAHPSVTANEMVEKANNDADLKEYIKYYEDNAGSLTLADDFTAEDGSAVTDYMLNRTYDIGKGMGACGVYFIRQKDGTDFKIGNTTYTIGSILISVPNANAHQSKASGGDVFTITVNPKPVETSTTTPGNPPGGGGNPPGPGTGRRVPPSQGSVLGASRDEMIPPEVLGANRLPQTGQLWWPVPVLCILGLGLIGSGVHRRRTAEAVH